MKGEKEQQKFPNIQVWLKDPEETDFQRFAGVRTVQRDAGKVKTEQDWSLEEATARDFHYLVQTVKRGVETTQSDEVEI